VFAVGVAVILVCLGAIHLLTNLLYASRLERLALKIARPVLWLTWPLILLGNVKTRLGVLTVNSPNTDSGSEVMKDEEELSAEPLSDPVDEREARMIRGVIRQDKTVAREIMVPRVDIVAVEIGTQIEVLASLMVDCGHSRVPVYRGDLDHVIGIAYSKDLLRHLSPGNGDVNLNQSLQEVIRPSLFIPESKTLEELLGEFKNRRVHIAIVIDEYGGVSGLVTIEDLIEEIVGEIEDEFDLGEAEIERINNDEFVMNASVNLDQLRDLFSVEIQSDGFDTVGGLVYQRLGKIPSSGDSVEHVGIRIEVLSTSGRRLKNLKVTKLPEFKS
jgi:CBS domain containing-hemolysin-like protein